MTRSEGKAYEDKGISSSGFLFPLFSGLCPRMIALPHCIARERSNLKSALPNARVGGKDWQVRKCQPRFRWMVTVAWLPPEACRPVT